MLLCMCIKFKLLSIMQSAIYIKCNTMPLSYNQTRPCPIMLKILPISLVPKSHILYLLVSEVDLLVP